MKNTLVVNLLGAPGAGKSTGAAYIFSQLKMRDINAELVTEFAKDKVWEENPTPFKNQLYMFAKQEYRLARCNGKVDVIITDSPLLLSIYYNKDPKLTQNFNNCVMDVFNSYNNICYYVKRVKPYNPEGRFQTEKESDKDAGAIFDMLKSYNIELTTIDGDKKDYDSVVEEVYQLLQNKG